MRPAISASFLLLMLLFATAQGIRLKGELSSSFQRKLQEVKNSTPTGGGAYLCSKGGHCASGTMGKSKFTKETKEVPHKLPGFHEDYYGPRNHDPKHH